MQGVESNMRDYVLEAGSLSEAELRRKYAEICEAYDKMSDDILYLCGQVRALKKELSELSAGPEKSSGKGNDER